MNILSDKAELRRSSLGKRQALPATERANATDAICATLVKTIGQHASSKRIIAGYAAIRGELDIMQALTLLAPDHDLALPVLRAGDREMYFCHWRLEDILTSGKHSIPEPQAPHRIVSPDIVIVPLLAFDRQFHRLGYGAGYYDTALHTLRLQNPSLIAVGAAFSIQEVASIGALPHDEKLDWIVTEKEIILHR